jgi:hypothetical protein
LTAAIRIRDIDRHSIWMQMIPEFKEDGISINLPNFKKQSQKFVAAFAEM